MGLLSALQNLVAKNVSVANREKVVSAVDTALTVLTSPIAAIKNFSKAKEETSKKSTAKLVAEGVENTLLVVAPFSAAGKTLAAKAATYAFSSVPKAAVTITAAGAAIASPTVRNVATSALTPSNYIGAGEKIGQFIEAAPTDVKDLASKSVVLAATGLGIVGVGAAAYSLLNDDDKENPTPTLIPELEGNKQLTPSVIPTNTETPVIPETVRVSSTPTKRKKRSTTKREPQNIIQKTNIIINNSNNSIKHKTKKYLNGKVY